MNGHARQIYKFDNFRLDVGERQLLRDGKPITLPSKAFDLLLVLVENHGHLLAKEELYNRVWRDQIVEESNLTVQMSAIRKALGESRAKPRYIGTVIGTGYRFTANVRIANQAENELIFETESIERVIIEREEIEREQGRNSNDVKSLWQLNFAFSLFRRFSLSQILVVVFLLLATGFGGYWFYQNRSQPQVNPAPESRRQIAITRITNEGRIDGAAVSPDRKYMVYVLAESEGNSMWLRQIGTASDIRLLPPSKAEFWGLTFSPDSRFIYYNFFAGDKIDFELFRMSSLGGVVEKIPNVSSRAITFSPDGKQIAFIQSDSGLGFNSLVIADVDGKNPQIFAKKNYPNTFFSEGQAVAWSPDGNTIACLVNQSDASANYFTIVGVNPKDGSEISLGERHWYEVSGIEWAKNSRGLFISAKDKLSAHTQIWMLPFSNGEPRQITNDLNEYSWLSVTADGESLAAIQTNAVNSVFVGEIGADDFKEIVSEVGELNPLVWTPDGKIVFSSGKDGVSNLWMMNADGTQRRQLTANAQIDARGLCISPDGKYLVFVSRRAGQSNLWRTDTEGGDLTQLTDGEADAYPRCLPDRPSVIFQRGIYTKPMLWKVPLAGGKAEQLTEFRAKWAAISNDGSRISYFQMADGKWRVGIISSTDLNVLQRLDAPADIKNSTVYWSPDNRSLLYIGSNGSVGNIRSLPLDGSETKSLTAFTSHWLADFSLSADGKHLAVTRSRSISDAVLVENSASP